MTANERPGQVFVTGGTGFIGSAVLEELLARDCESLVCLTRRPEVLEPVVATHRGVRVVEGDLTAPSRYQEALAGSAVVVHLAATTGSAREHELRRVNVDGTRLLLDACAAHGVGRIVHISSIAAGYDDLGDYPYGRSKLEGERLVRESGLDFTILRPTIVLGKRSPAWQMLRRMASLPLVPLLRGGATRVQPVDVSDVARGIVALVGGFRSESPIVELGGPEVVSFVELMGRIRSAWGLDAIRTASIPVWMLREPLRAVGWLLRGAVPVSVGQLTPFLMDGTAKRNALHEALLPDMAPLDTTLARLAHAR